MKPMNDLMKLHSNVSLNETMCRIYDSGWTTSLKVMVILKWLKNLIDFVIIYLISLIRSLL